MIVRRHALVGSLALVVVVAAIGGGCQSYTQLAEPVRAEIEAAREGMLVWTKQSLYVGQFYDDDRFDLAYPRRFEEITYLRTVEGDPITPPPADGIIPAGTRVRIESIEFPTGDAVFKRPLYTPRYTTWVFLRVAHDTTDTRIERDKKAILLIPGGIPDEATFHHWFGVFFTESDPHAWLSSLSEPVRAGVLEKRPVVGMDYDTLTAAMGYPDRLSKEGNDDGTTEVAVWGPVSVVLERGVVTRVSDPLRPDVVQPELPAPAATIETPPPALDVAPVEPLPPPLDAPSTTPSDAPPTDAAPVEPAPVDAVPAPAAGDVEAPPSSEEPH